MKIGPYAIEQNYSQYAASASNTILAIIGTATKGPLNHVEICTSTQDRLNKFGKLNPDCLGLYAAQYFLSQASKLYYIRVASDSAAEATVVVKGLNSSDVEVSDALSLKALEPGTYMNGSYVVITAGTEEDTFTITVKNANNITLETIKNIEFDDLVVGYKSAYFEVSAASLVAVSLSAGTYTFAGGNDGLEDIDSNAYINALELLVPESIDANLLAIPGVSDPEVIEAGLTFAQTRGDIFYLVDPPQGLTRDGVVAWHNGGEDYVHTKFNSSYGGLYYPWVQIYDTVSRSYQYVPPSTVVAPSIAYSDRISELWYAPAGLNRGIIRGAIGVEEKLSAADVELLYSEDNNINCIYNDPQVGLVIWGQKTLDRVDSALNRVNVRRLLNYLKRVVVAACRTLTFDPNDYITWNSFELLVDPILRSIKSRRGVYEYSIVKGERIVTDNDIDNYRMPCMVLIRPTKAAETIPIYFAITSTGADFNDVLDTIGLE